MELLYFQFTSKQQLKVHFLLLISHRTIFFWAAVNTDCVHDEVSSLTLKLLFLSSLTGKRQIFSNSSSSFRTLEMVSPPISLLFCALIVNPSLACSIFSLMSLNNWTLCSSLFPHHLIPSLLWPQEQCDEWVFSKKAIKYSSAPKLLNEKLRIYHSQSARFHVGHFQIQHPLISEREGRCYSAASFMHWGEVCNPIVWKKGNSAWRKALRGTRSCILLRCITVYGTVTSWFPHNWK